MISFAHSNKQGCLRVVQGPCLLLVQSGSGVATAKPSLSAEELDSCPQLAKGSVFFVPASTPVALTAGAEPLSVWIAAVNSKFFARALSGGVSAEERVAQLV